MKRYLLCKDINEDYERIWLETEEEVEIGDLAVYMDFDSPSLCIVKEFVDELKAITSDLNFNEPIKIISMRAYMEKRAKQIQKAKLVKLMKEQMEIQKLEDTLKKNSECNEEMAKLFAQYKELNG